MAKKQNKEQVRVSLLPGGEDVAEGKTPATRKFLIIILLAVVVVLIAGTGYLKIQTGRIHESVVQQRDELARINAQVASLKGDIKQVGDLGQRVGFAKSALDSHIAAEWILAILESAAIPEVALDQLAADAAGTLVLSARGKDFNAVTRQIMAWRAHKQITDAQVSGVSTMVNKLGEIEGIDFNATITLNAQALKWQP